jgi:hypothetical protein
MRGSLLDELWKAHFIDRKVRLAFENLLSEDDAPLVRAICNKANGVTPSEVRASIKRAKITIDFPSPTVPERPVRAATSAVISKPKAFTSRHEAGKKAWATMTAMAEATLPNLIAAGFVKAPLELERTYKGVRLTASIRPDGQVTFGNESCVSLSAAGGIARKSVLGTSPKEQPPATNGWTFWQFRDPKTGDLREIDCLRQEFLASRKSRQAAV